MPPRDGPLWPYFHKSKDKPNGSHHRATHWCCIDAKRPQNEPIDVDASADVTLIKNTEWFEEALADALEAKDDVNGKKKAMASHLRTCPHATAPEKAKAAEVALTQTEQKAAAQTKAELLAAEHSDEEPDAGALDSE
ncbi:hypothetical protein GGX14DRAFT_574748 [Mycena pura]|uniref:Uncharacterized protein n=1 Tax=Mycena pura TaxID=153505 RepID=A0AAD6Y4U6_9AGAR|nr:hypothetical protein GGX14DRAFT_574748 [Mycena pura]